MNDEIKISEQAREAARIYFDCHPDSPQWTSEVEDLASRFESYADSRVKQLDTNRRAFIAELESVLAQRDQRIAELEAALKCAINTVECDSLDKDGNELPWYRQAKKALGEKTV